MVEYVFKRTEENDSMYGVRYKDNVLEVFETKISHNSKRGLGGIIGSDTVTKAKYVHGSLCVFDGNIIPITTGKGVIPQVYSCIGHVDERVHAQKHQPGLKLYYRGRKLFTILTPLRTF